MKYFLMTAVLAGLTVSKIAFATVPNIIGEYHGRVFTGSDVDVIRCTVTVKKSPSGSFDVTLVSARRTDTLVWEGYDANLDYQRNQQNEGYILTSKNADGTLSTINMQYETAPNPASPYNTSLVSEYCEKLAK